MSRGALAVAVAVITAVITAVLARPVRAQFFSPGALARPHGNLEGLEKCSKCHEQEKGLSAKLCLDCHGELAGRIARGAGYHGRLPAETRQACQGCHPDHRGVEFAMVEWERGRDKFNHQRTGWPLKGAHAKARCDDCHQRRSITDPGIRQMLDRQPKRTTHLGLSQRCDSCHFDEHRGQLGRECQKCHGETAWKPPVSFNHQATTYPLEGKHRDVACAKCHPSTNDNLPPPTAFPKPRSAAFMQMKPIDFKTCESCHQDPHKGTLGPACASCHSEVGWKIIKSNKGQDASFHDKTRFPLRGGHVGVTCRSCHGPFPGQPPRFKGLAFGACGDCHEDAHLGQLRPRPPAKTLACDLCHTVNAFAPPRYELEQHQRTRFPLEGGHAVAACRGCHPVEPRLAARITASVHHILRARKRPERFSLVVLRPRGGAGGPQACASCHEDVHRGQLADTKNEDNCHTCHQVTSFSELTFDHDKDSRFPLTGKHARTACGGCHKSEGGGARQESMLIRYKPLDLACGSCHADTHQGQFLSGEAPRPSGKEGSRRKARDCDHCHTTTAFKGSTFDHDNRRFTAFSLEGRHAKVACKACHPTVAVADDVTTVRYRPLPRACEDCHVDFHHGEFRGFEP